MYSFIRQLTSIDDTLKKKDTSMRVQIKCKRKLKLRESPIGNIHEREYFISV